MVWEWRAEETDAAWQGRLLSWAHVLGGREGSGSAWSLEGGGSVVLGVLVAVTSQGHTAPTSQERCPGPFQRGAALGAEGGLEAVGNGLWESAHPSEALPPPVPQELEKCEANHYIILFRDAGCQFRALYCYYPDSEEICKLTGTGPRSISKKMIDKLYKYSSDRKQFNLIPAKTMSVSVDALTIHNHLWQPKRPAAPKKTQARK